MKKQQVHGRQQIDMSRIVVVVYVQRKHNLPCVNTSAVTEVKHFELCQSLVG